MQTEMEVGTAGRRPNGGFGEVILIRLGNVVDPDGASGSSHTVLLRQPSILFGIPASPGFADSDPSCYMLPGGQNLPGRQILSAQVRASAVGNPEMLCVQLLQF